MDIDVARQKFKVVNVVAPNDLNPGFEIKDVKDCSLETGKCSRCEKFKGVYTEDAIFTIYETFEGFCNTKVA